MMPSGAESISTPAPLFLTATAGSNSTTDLDVPLAQAIDISEVRYIGSSDVRWAYQVTVGRAAIQLWLMNGTTELLPLTSWGFSGNFTVETSQILRFAREISEDEIASLPTSEVDGLRFKLIQQNALGGATSTLTAIDPNDLLQVTFATCEVGSCGPHRAEEFLGLPAISYGIGSTSPTPWEEVPFDQPIPVDALRYVYAGPFHASWNISGGLAAALEVQLALNDGTFLTLDDVRSPSTLSPPDTVIHNEFSSLLLTDAQQEDLSGLWALGFRYRVEKGTGGSSAFTFTPGCPTTICTGLSEDRPLEVSLIFDIPECTGFPALAATDLAPEDGSVFGEGSSVVLTGQIQQPPVGTPIAAVFVNGAPADSVDATGSFFKRVSVGSGVNPYDVRVVQSGCGESTSSVSLEGVPSELIAYENLTDISTQITPSYSRTTFNRYADRFLVDVEACNSGASKIAAPLQMVISRFPVASQDLATAEGLTLDGKPFVVIDDFGGDAILDPTECAAPKTLAFSNPDKERVTFDVRWLAPLNSAPYFTSVPVTRVKAGGSYSYGAAAADVDGQGLTLSLERGPSGMSIDPNGTVAWLPTTGDLGSHSVTLAVSDGFGGIGRQSFMLEVTDGSSNQSPYLTSSPATRAAVGATYSYQATASDPDGDPLSWSLISGPAGSIFDPNSGLLTWDFALGGTYPVEITVSDPSGGAASQQYALTVGSPVVNPTVPQIFGSPGSQVAVGQLYLYQPVPSTPDPNDVYQFSLSLSPAGMGIDPNSGLVSWTPDPNQLGSHSVVLELDDGSGATTTQAWSLEVLAALPNAAPAIVTLPGLVAVQGDPYAYAAHATDPDGDTVTYSLVSPPAGMAIDPNTGLLTWTPASTGTFQVAVRAEDPEGAYGAQVYDLEVVPPNTDPVITSSPPAGATLVGGSYLYDVEATDAEAQELEYILKAAPAGMAIHPQLGIISWVPQAGDEGVHTVQVRVADTAGGSDLQAFDVTIDPDVTSPIVTLSLSAPQVVMGTQARACVEATDDVGVVTQRLLVDSVETPLDPIGCLILEYAQPATVMLRAEATDAQGNLSFQEQNLLVIDPDNGTRPFVDPNSIVPTPGSVVTAVTDIYATITDDDPNFLTWEVRLKRDGDPNFTIIGSGSGDVTNGIVATLDTTLLPNDNYTIQIDATDGALTGGVEYTYGIAGELKLGNFEVTFTDLRLPLAGIPIVVGRTYSSLDTRSYEFGAGWRLALPGDVSDSAKEATSPELIGALGNEPFTRLTRVYVTKPNGQRVGFTFSPKPVNTAGEVLLPFVQLAAFNPDPGVTDTLEAVPTSGTQTVWDFDGRFFDFIIPFNPSTYVLTEESGLRFTIDENDGLRLIEDSNGNTISVSNSGMLSSTGVGITFTRDSYGRIVQILEPADPNLPGPPPSLNYSYDSQGNLIAIQDQVARLTTFEYTDPSHPNHLTEIIDSSGARPVRSAFDSSGRLLGFCGPDGDIVTLLGCTRVDSFPSSQLQTITDPRGFRTDFFLDSTGNPLTTRRWLDPNTFTDTHATYDVHGRLLTRTDSQGNTDSFTYDSQGNPIIATDPSGYSLLREFGPCGLISYEDPLGNATTFIYDSACHLLSRTSPLGGRTSYTYGSLGRLRTITDPVGNQWSVSYDALGYPTSFTNPRGHTASIVFSLSGEIQSLTDANGRTRTFAYHADHRLATETWDTTPPTVITYSYGPTGNLTSASTGTSSVDITYWNAGGIREILTTIDGAPLSYGIEYSILDPNGSTVTGYDGNGNRIASRDSTGRLHYFTYDYQNRLDSVSRSTIPVDPNAAGAVQIAYDSAGLLSTIDRYPGASFPTPTLRTLFTYQCPGCSSRLTGVSHIQLPGGSPIHTMTFVRDPAARVVEYADKEGTHNVSLDADGRVLSIDHPQPEYPSDELYAYDSAGNRTTSHASTSYVLGYSTPSGGSQLLETDQHTYQYDGSGNLIGRSDIGTGVSTEYLYDHRDRLISVVTRDSSNVILDEMSFQYDALNRRIRESVDGLDHWVFWDATHPIAEFDPNGQLLTSRTYLPGIDNPLAEEQNGQLLWLLTDHLGTVRDLADRNGAHVQHFVLDGFGNLVSQLGPLPDTDLALHGRQFGGTPELGYFRARYYSPEIGRFIQPDPVPPFGYQFVENNPFSYVDPSGRVAATEEGVVEANFSQSALCISTGVGAALVGLIKGFEAAAEFEKEIFADDPEQLADIQEEIAQLKKVRFFLMALLAAPGFVCSVAKITGG